MLLWFVVCVVSLGVCLVVLWRSRLRLRGWLTCWCLVGLCWLVAMLWFVLHMCCLRCFDVVAVMWFVLRSCSFLRLVFNSVVVILFYVVFLFLFGLLLCIVLDSCVVAVIVRWPVAVCCLLDGLLVDLVTFDSVLKSFGCCDFWVLRVVFILYDCYAGLSALAGVGGLVRFALFGCCCIASGLPFSCFER